MKPHYLKPIVALFASIVVFTSCEKDVNPRSNTSEVFSALKNVTTDNSTLTTGATSQIIAQIKGVDLTVLDGIIQDQKVKFTVTNLGTIASPKCIAQVAYRCNSSFKYAYVTIPSIAGAGAIVTRVHLSVPVEAVCFNSDIQFTITADYYKTVTETNESNNTFSGTKIN